MRNRGQSRRYLVCTIACALDALDEGARMKQERVDEPQDVLLVDPDQRGQPPLRGHPCCGSGLCPFSHRCAKKMKSSGPRNSLGGTRHNSEVRKLGSGDGHRRRRRRIASRVDDAHERVQVEQHGVVGRTGLHVNELYKQRPLHVNIIIGGKLIVVPTDACHSRSARLCR